MSYKYKIKIINMYIMNRTFGVVSVKDEEVQDKLKVICSWIPNIWRGPNMEVAGVVSSNCGTKQITGKNVEKRMDWFFMKGKMVESYMTSYR